MAKTALNLERGRAMQAMQALQAMQAMQALQAMQVLAQQLVLLKRWGPSVLVPWSVLELVLLQKAT